MTEQTKMLVTTLVKRGESDNYIINRLLSVGFKDDEAKQIIRETRLNAEVAQPHLMTETEGALLVIGMIILLALFAWMLLVIF
jgi:hypothetical protein